MKTAEPDYATCTDDDLRRLAKHGNTDRVRAGASAALRARVTRTREDDEDDEDDGRGDNLNDLHAQVAYYQHEANLAARQRDAARAAIDRVEALLDAETAAFVSRVDIDMVRAALAGTTAGCDFDECEAPATERRAPMTYCPQHAAQHDAPEHAALEREPKHALQVVLEAGFDPDCIRSYSGRGMYGRECLAVTGSFQAIMAGVVNALLDEASGLTAFQRLEVRDAVEDVKMDSMGRDTIVYFPGAVYVPDGEAG